jgi:HEAT repeat protein
MEHLGHRLKNTVGFKEITMDKSVDRANENADEGTDTIASLIATLSSDDGLKRQRARQRLVAIGRPALAPLVKALADPNDQVRWEAAKALGKIGDPATAPALVNALQDGNCGIRWLAAEGLIVLERQGLTPLLQALVERSDSEWLREGAHHVLHALARRGLGDLLSPVLAALEDIEPVLEVCPAAQAALDALMQAPGRRDKSLKRPRLKAR